MTNARLLRSLLDNAQSGQNETLVVEAFFRLRQAERRALRHQPTNLHKELPEDVDVDLNSTLPAQLIHNFLDCVQKHCRKNKINGFLKEHAAKILLYQIITNETVRDVEHHTHFCHSKMPNIIKHLKFALQIYTERNLGIKEHNTRLEISRRLIPRREDTPETASNLTALLDGVDIRIFKPSDELAYFDHQKFYPYKFKKSGLRCQIVTDIDGNFEWVSSSTPAGKHDFVQYLQNQVLISREYEQDTIGADLGYIGDSALNIVTSFKNAASGSDEEEFNRSFNS
jgi:hypothetical protein